MDPGDLVDYGADYAPILQTADGEELDPGEFQITPSAEAVLAGFQVGDGLRGPAITDDGQKLQMWFSVDAGHQNDSEFDAGILCALNVVARTQLPGDADGSRYRIYERTFTVKVVNL